MRFEEENKVLFENSSDSIIVLQDGLLKHINSNGFRTIGYDPDEIIGHHFAEFVYEEDLALVIQRYEKRINHEPIPEVYPFRLVSKTGERIWFEIHALEIMWEGRPASLTFFNNINKRKVAEEALSRREAQIRAVLDAIPDMMFQVKRDGHITKYRPAKKTGYDFTDSFTGRHVSEIVPSDIYEECIFKINESFSSREVQIFEFPVNNVKGRWFYEARIVAFRVDEVLAVVRDITKRKFREDALKKNQESLQKEVDRLRSSICGRNPFEGIVGRSPAMTDVLEQIMKAASSLAPVIIFGESGTGKELVARAIHDLSERASGRFVPVNCGAIPENLLESEFFGYRKGAFTGAVSDKKGFLELADSGSLFMDEIGEIGLNMQVKLLRALEGGGIIPVGGSEVLRPDFRIIGATNRKPIDLVRKGLLREDFFYRINIVQINLPPLRERLEDLPLLVYHFLEKFGRQGEFLSLPKGTMARLMNHDWPGNVRELQNVIHRYVTMGRIELPERSGNKESERPGPSTDGGLDLKNAVDGFEREHILKALEKTRWQKAKASELLGVHRKTLFRKMKELGIE